MRAQLAIARPLAHDQTTRKRAIGGDPKTQLTMLTPAIVDKIQVLALRRPRALIGVAQALDKLLDEQLELLLD